MNNFSALLRVGNKLPEGSISFGKYPTNQELDIIKNAGYSVIVDLCQTNEITWESYPKDGFEYLHFPIKDRTPVGKNKITEFRQLIDLLRQRLIEQKSIYIHCRGGHGRSSMVAAILLGKVEELRVEECLKQVYDAHQLRIEMKPEWRRLGAPQTDAQKRFVVNELTK